MCEQQRLRPACAYAQTDQCLCWSLKYSMTVKLLTEPHLRFLSLKGSCTGSSKFSLIKMSHCYKSHVMAYFSSRQGAVDATCKQLSGISSSSLNCTADSKLDKNQNFKVKAGFDISRARLMPEDRIENLQRFIEVNMGLVATKPSSGLP